LLPVLDAAGGATRFRFHCSPFPAGLRWRVLASPDLGGWHHVLWDSVADGPPDAGEGWFNGSVTVPPALAPGAAAPDGRMFLRLEASLLP
jgi:hypothetical protein